VPSNAGLQKQLLISAPAIRAGVLPENRAGLACASTRLASTSESAPLYTRDCARLI
jgi:hypothetical protein